MRLIQQTFIFLLTILISQLVYGQSSGNSVFDINVMHEVRLEFTQSNFLQQMHDNYSDSYFTGEIEYIEATVTIDGETVENIGSRFKGFTSYNFSNPKNPIKLDFNEYVPGQRLDGLRKLNLNNSTGDPAMQRDIIAYHLMRKMGVAAPRTSFARVYFNDEYQGVYQLIEQVDKEFLEGNFAHSDGNLFKNKDWAYWDWLGPNGLSYSPPFEVRTHKDDPDWSGVVNLHDVLNNTADAQFAEEIQKVFNVPLFLKVLAVDVATNNWDSDLEHGRNWYMYHDRQRDLVSWIPWDYNFSLGGGYFESSTDDCNLFAFFSSFHNGTTTVPFFDRSWTAGSEVIAEWDFGDNSFSTEAEPIHTYSEHGIYEVCYTITRADDETCIDQVCNFIDTQYDPNECAVIVDGSGPASADTVFQQILEYFPSCCDLWDENCEEWYEILSNDQSNGGNFEIDQRENERLLTSRLLSVPEFYEEYLGYFCELTDKIMEEQDLFDIMDFNFNLIDESVAEDPNFLFAYETYRKDIGADGLTGLKQYLQNRIVGLQNEISTTADCSSLDISVNYNEIVINEIVASNDSTSTIKDQDDGYDDWVELYNTSQRPIDISTLYLTNDASELKKWRIPVGTIMEPNTYLIVWMDEDVNQEGFHANFKLPKAGATLILSNRDGDYVDELEYGEQTTNIAYARIPNGTGSFSQRQPTFGYNNEFPSSTEDRELEYAIYVQPNPTLDISTVVVDEAFGHQYDVVILNAAGQLIQRVQQKGKNFQLDLSTQPTGVYVLQLRNEKGDIVTKKVVKLQ